MARRTVLATPFELLRVCEGNTLTFADQNGEAVDIRLFTADELMEANRLAKENLPGGGPPLMSRAEAEKATRPLGKF